MYEKHDCDVCHSAGSVNQWGICEVCGEEFEGDAAEAVFLVELDGTLPAPADDETEPNPPGTLPVRPAPDSA